MPEAGGSPPARELALAVLSVARKGARPEEILDALSGKYSPEPRELALASRIALGVLQNMYLLDFYIGTYSSVKPEKMDLRALDILRSGAYQLLFLDRIPARAAVNESVRLVKKSGISSASGLVNAVLRRISEAAPDALPTVPGKGTPGYLSVKYSHPLWLAEEYVSELGYSQAQALMRANNETAPLTVQVNTLKTTAEELEKALALAGLDVRCHPFLSDCLEVNTGSGLTTLDEFKNGLFYVQDAASRLAVIAAGVEPGMRVLDCCAAPGGKSFAAAIAMRNEGSVLSCDISEKKLRRISEGAVRLGTDIVKAAKMDAKQPEPNLCAAFDVVIADVPCSGFGVIRRKPEIRYKPKENVAQLHTIQVDIINSIAKCVKPGGVLIYSTCTTRQDENNSVVEEFIRDNSSFEQEPPSLPTDNSGMKKGNITLFPHIHGTDGFYICRLRRSGI